MEYDTEYCFSAKTKFLSMPVQCQSSEWHCVTTPPGTTTLHVCVCERVNIFLPVWQVERNVTKPDTEVKERLMFVFYCVCMSLYISKMSIKKNSLVFSLIKVLFRFYTVSSDMAWWLGMYVCICVTYSWLPSPSRPCHWPAAEGGCGYCCSICVHVFVGGGWLPSLSLPDGERTEEPIYTGNAKTHTHIWKLVDLDFLAHTNMLYQYIRLSSFFVIVVIFIMNTLS